MKNIQIDGKIAALIIIIVLISVALTFKIILNKHNNQNIIEETTEINVNNPILTNLTGCTDIDEKGNPLNPTNTFNENSIVIYIATLIDQVYSPTDFKLVWYYNNSLIEEVSFTIEKPTNFYSPLKSTNNFEKGTYTATISLADGTVLGSINLFVE